MNRITGDAMGPYVHSRLTLEWARGIGYSVEEAEAIARADLGVDAEYPARRSPATLSRHFAPTAWMWGAAYYRKAVSDCDLVALGRALHCLQDVYAHGWFGLAHIRFNLGMGRDPDDWEAAPTRERARIETTSRRVLTAYLNRCRGGSRRL
jgi:hypothetical protein